MKIQLEAPVFCSRNNLGAIVAYILEWYDFALYGYLAPVSGSQAWIGLPASVERRATTRVPRCD